MHFAKFIFSICLSLTVMKCAEAVQYQCDTWGDPNYFTFDRVRIIFQGKCKYILSMPDSKLVKKKDPCFYKLEAQNSHWPRTSTNAQGASAVLYVDLYIFGHKFRFDQGGTLKVDGKNIESRSFHEPGVLTIRPSGNSLIASIPKCKLRMHWDGNINFRTFLIGNKWRGKTKGLCGNCNGNKNDDMITRDGTTVKSVPELANSYLVGTDMHSNRHCPATVRMNRHPCRKRYRRMVDRIQLCGSLRFIERGPFHECLKDLRVNLRDRYQACRSDVCLSGRSRNHSRNKKRMQKIACNALRQIASRCDALNLEYDDDWEEQTNCKIRCPPGMTFKPKVRPCPATCLERNTRRCRFEKRTGACRCPRDKVQYAGKCVRPSQCPSGSTQNKIPGNMHLMFMKFMRQMRRGKPMPGNMLGAPNHKNGPIFNWNQQGKNNGGVKIPNVAFNFNFGGSGKAHIGVQFQVQHMSFVRLDNGELVMLIGQGRSYLYPKAKRTNFGTRVAGGAVRILPGFHSSIIGNGVIRVVNGKKMIHMNGKKIIVSPKFFPANLIRIPKDQVVGQGRIITLPNQKQIVVRVDHSRAKRPRNIVQIVSPIQKIRKPRIPFTVRIGKNGRVIIQPGGQTNINRGGELLVDGNGREFVPINNNEYIVLLSDFD